MKATTTLRPSASSPCSVAGPSAITWPLRTRAPRRTIGFWLMQVFWFERWYLIRLMMSTFEPTPSSSSGLITMRAGVDRLDHAVALGHHGDAGVARDHGLETGADQRRLRAHQRHRLALHVGSHQRAVRVVVLQEGDQRGRHRHQLIRRHVHHVDLGGRHRDELAGLARLHRRRRGSVPARPPPRSPARSRGAPRRAPSGTSPRARPCRPSPRGRASR